MITPLTHPKHYIPITLGPGYAYWQVARMSLRVQEELAKLSEDFWRNYYREVRAHELKDGAIDEEKYKAWLSAGDNPNEAREGNNRFLRAKAKIFLIPQNDSPAIDSEEFWDGVTSEELYEVFSFTRPMSDSSTNGQTTSAIAIAVSPDSSTEA